MTPRTVRKLSGLQIDEVSLVDRPANQHGLVAIAKRDGGTSMGRFAKAEDDDPVVFDSEGIEVFPNELEAGDVVYDEAGTELVYVPDEDDGGDGLDSDDYVDQEDVYADDGELAGVGKSFTRRAQLMGLRGAIQGRAAVRSARGAASNVRTGVEEYRAAGGAGARARRAANNAPGRVRRNASRVAGQHPTAVGRSRTGAIAGGGAAAGYGAGSGRRRVRKNLGEDIYTTLSKALSAEDSRSEIRKFATELSSELSKRDEAIGYLTELVEGMYEDRESELFTKMADEYDLPVAPEELGEVLKAASQALPPEHVDLLDRIFKAASEARIFDTVGYEGPERGGVMDMISAAANEVVGKNSDVTPEQAMTALLASNPGAYDEYLSEHPAQMRGGF